VVEKPKTKTEQAKDELLDKLKALRKQIADEQNVPAYVVFTDTTLEDMARQRPTTPDGLRNVSGVGERKLQLFGPRFLSEIVGYVTSKAKDGSTLRGSTQLLTLELYNRGLSMEEIAVERKLTTGSIANHLVHLYKSGYSIDIEELISKPEALEIEAAINEIGLPEGRLKPVYDHFNGRYDYGKIQLVAGLMQ
jgi:ATP-dependent DNA helicase RecQ